MSQVSVSNLGSIETSLSTILSRMSSNSNNQSSGCDQAVVAIVAVILVLLVAGIIMACVWGAGTYPTYSPIGMMRLKMAKKKAEKAIPNKGQPVANNKGPVVRAAVEPASVEEVSESQVQALLAGTSPVVVMVYASWCGFCKKAAPVIAQIAAMHKDVRFVKIENTKAEALSKANGITGFPTFLHNFGEKKSIGYKTHEQMTALVSQAATMRTAHAQRYTQQQYRMQQQRQQQQQQRMHHQQHQQPMHQPMHQQPMHQQAMPHQQAMHPMQVMQHRQPMRGGASPQRAHRVDKSGGKVIEISSEDEVRNLLAGDMPVVVAVVAPWCSFCKKFAPVLDELALALANSPIKIVKIQNENCKALCDEKQISGFPTVLFNWGQGMDVGYKNAPEMMQLINSSNA